MAKDKSEKLHTLFDVREDGDKFRVCVIGGNLSVQVFDKKSEAERCVDLLNAAFHLFKKGEKSQGLNKPTKVGTPKKK